MMGEGMDGGLRMVATVEGVYMSPAAPESKEHVYSMWMDVLEHYDVDGINFDYVRYPAPDYDYSRISLDRFRLWLVPQLPDSTRARFAAMESDPLVYADSFFRATMTSAVRRSPNWSSASTTASRSGIPT